MTEFGKWMGKSNGLAMVSDVLNQDVTQEQARAVVTTYCILFGIEVDTAEWDHLMNHIWDCFNCWFNDFNEMDMFMCKDLV